jgi:hypothetical protein
MVGQMSDHILRNNETRMNNIKQSTTNNIPWWFRLIIIMFFIGVCGLSFLAIFMPPRSYFGFSHEFIVVTLFSGLLLLAPLVVGLSFFPGRSFARISYWLFYKFRWLLFFFSLYGFIEYALRLPLIYFVYSQPHLNTQVIFSIRGLVPLLLLSVLFWSILVAKPFQNPFTNSQQEKFSKIKENISKKITSIDSRWTGMLAASITPVIVLAVIYGVWGAKLSDYLPIFWNDATGYWLWARQFSHHGFNSGYNFANELMPAASFNRFGEGSPVYVYLYGMIGRIVGWTPQLPILINFGLITASVYIFSRARQFDSSQNLVLFTILLVSWPVLLFLPTTSHETLNQAIAIGMAGIFLSLQAENVGNGKKILFALFVFFAGLVRLSWVILFFPLLFFYFQGSLFRKVLLSVLIGGTLSIAIVLIIGYLVPPVNNSIFATLGGDNSSIFIAITDHFKREFRDLVRPGHMTPGLATIFIVMGLLGYSILDLSKKIDKKQPIETLLRSQAFFDFYNVSALLLAGMTLYLADGFYRVFFPPLMVSIFMQIAQKNYKFIKIMVVFSLLFAPLMANYNNDLHGTKINYTHKMEDVSASKPVLDRLVVFNETTNNPWCNTILITLNFYDGRLTALNPGIGISYILFHPLETIPIQSHYLLLAQEDHDKLLEEYNLRAIQLASLPIGNLYQNLDSDCEQ